MLKKNKFRWWKLLSRNWIGISIAYLFILVVVLGMGFLQLVNQEGFSNYSVQMPVDISRTKTQLDGQLISPENYLGTIRLPVLKSSARTDSKIGFEIFDLDNQPMASNSYQLSSVLMTEIFPFGFTPVANSANRLYRFRITATDPDLDLNQVFKLGLDKVDLEFNYSNHLAGVKREVLIKIMEYKIQRLLSQWSWFLGLMLMIFPGYLLVGYRLQRSSTAAVVQEIENGLSRVGWWLINLSLFRVALIGLMGICALVVIGRVQLANQLVKWEVLLLVLAMAKQIVQMNWQQLIKPGLVWLQTHLKLLGCLVVVIGLIILASSKTYYLGGDDTRMFYLYPQQYLQNFALNLGSDTAISDIRSVLPPLSIASFGLTIWGFRLLLPGVNLQQLFYGLNLVLAVYYFYRLLDLMVERRNQYSGWIFGLSGLAYVSSIFTIYTLDSAKLLSIYLLFVLPFSLFYLIKALRQRQFFWLIPVLLAWTILSVLAVSLPWFLGSLIGLGPMLIYLGYRYRGVSVRYLLIFSVLLVLLNLNWLFFLPYSAVVDNTNQVSGASMNSVQFRTENSAGIESVARINNLTLPLLGSYHYNLQANFHWAYWPIYQQWYQQLLPLNLWLVSLIMLVPLLKNRDQLGWYLMAVADLLLSIYLFTVNVGNWGIPAFVWMNDHLPGFVMFRNMFDKFGLVMAFNFSLALALALQMLTQTKYRLINWLMIGICAVVIGMLAKPWMWDEFNRQPVWTTAATYQSTTELNADYLALVKYLAAIPDGSRYLALPLNRGNLFFIQDQNLPNHFDAGVSPLLIMSGKNDYSGILSFGSLGESVMQALKHQEYQRFGEMMQRLNANYVIVNHTVTPDLAQSYLYSDGLLEQQDQAFYQHLLGPKVADFGQRYSLYRINPQFASDKIMLASDIAMPFAAVSNPVTYRRVSSHRFDVEIRAQNQPQYLVFLEPYSQNWRLVASRSKVQISPIDLGYAMAWKIEPSGLPQQYQIEFGPAKYQASLNWAVAILAGSLLVYWGWQLRRFKQKS